MDNSFTFHSIATVKSCYKEKFGIPRQPGLSNSAKSIIEFADNYNDEDYIKGLEGFSHIWVIFIFHKHLDKEIKPTVRPPRLGGNKKIGVFASRSPFRPNPVGMSVVRLEKITRVDNKIQLHISSADLLDGTPVVDIKPYIAYADAINDSEDAYAVNQPEYKLAVEFSDDANKVLEKLNDEDSVFKNLIIETLSLDPRPAYIKDDSKVYGINLNNYNIRWSVEDDIVTVLEISSV